MSAPALPTTHPILVRGSRGYWIAQWLLSTFLGVASVLCLGLVLSAWSPYVEMYLLALPLMVLLGMFARRLRSLAYYGVPMTARVEEPLWLRIVTGSVFTALLLSVTPLLQLVSPTEGVLYLLVPSLLCVAMVSVGLLSVWNGWVWHRSLAYALAPGGIYLVGAVVLGVALAPVIASTPMAGVMLAAFFPYLFAVMALWQMMTGRPLLWLPSAVKREREQEAAAADWYRRWAEADIAADDAARDVEGRAARVRALRT